MNKNERSLSLTCQWPKSRPHCCSWARRTFLGRGRRRMRGSWYVEVIQEHHFNAPLLLVVCLIFKNQKYVYFCMQSQQQMPPRIRYFQTTTIYMARLPPIPVCSSWHTASEFRKAKRLFEFQQQQQQQNLDYKNGSSIESSMLMMMRQPPHTSEAMTVQHRFRVQPQNGPTIVQKIPPP